MEGADFWAAGLRGQELEDIGEKDAAAGEKPGAAGADSGEFAEGLEEGGPSFPAERKRVGKKLQKQNRKVSGKLGRGVEVHPVGPETIALVDGVDVAAGEARADGGRELMPDGAARLVVDGETLLPGAEAQFHVFPAEGSEELFKAAEGEKAFAVEERGAAAGPESEDGRGRRGTEGIDVETLVDTKEAAAESGELRAATKKAGSEIVDLAGDGEDERVGEVREKSAQSVGFEGDVVVEDIDGGITGGADTTIDGGSKAAARWGRFTAHGGKVIAEPGERVVRAGVVGDENFRGQGARGAEGVDRLQDAGQEFLEKGAAVPTGNHNAEARRGGRSGGHQDSCGVGRRAHNCREEGPPKRLLSHSQG